VVIKLETLLNDPSRFAAYTPGGLMKRGTTLRSFRDDDQKHFEAVSEEFVEEEFVSDWIASQGIIGDALVEELTEDFGRAKAWKEFEKNNALARKTYWSEKKKHLWSGHVPCM
jgi:hypothetical protein